MFGMGMPEIMLILAIALIVIGPKKLPDLAKSLGRALGEFKHATKEFKSAIDIDEDVKSIGKPFDDLSEQVKKNFSSSSTEDIEDDDPSDEKTESKKTAEKGNGKKANDDADAVFTRNSAETYPEAEAGADESALNAASSETDTVKEDAKA